MSYQLLLGELDEWFARGVADAGHDVVLCRRGCSACCHGPFDISPADAELAAQAVSRLDPGTRSLVQLRALDQVTRYAELAHGAWTSPWDPGAIGDPQFDRICQRLARQPCPALGSDGVCLIYDSRPATCRIIGLAMRLPDGQVLHNDCPILHTSAGYAALNPTLFDLPALEETAEDRDIEAMERGWRRTTVAGAIHRPISTPPLPTTTSGCT